MGEKYKVAGEAYGSKGKYLLAVATSPATLCELRRTLDFLSGKAAKKI